MERLNLTFLILVLTLLSSCAHLGSSNGKNAKEAKSYHPYPTYPSYAPEDSSRLTTRGTADLHNDDPTFFNSETHMKVPPSYFRPITPDQTCPKKKPGSSINERCE